MKTALKDDARFFYSRSRQIFRKCSTGQKCDALILKLHKAGCKRPIKTKFLELGGGAHSVLRCVYGYLTMMTTVQKKSEIINIFCLQHCMFNIAYSYLDTLTSVQ